MSDWGTWPAADLARSVASAAAASVRSTACHAARRASSAVSLTAPLPRSYVSVVRSLTCVFAG